LIKILIIFFGDEIYREEIIVIMQKWVYQILKWVVDIYTSQKFSLLTKSKEGLNLILDICTFPEDLLIKEFIVDYRFANTEKLIFEYMGKEEKSAEYFIYRLAKINDNFLKDVTDNNTIEDLKDDLDNYTF
jgi:hypothetical protein